MKKVFLSATLAAICFQAAFSEPVNLQTATSVATHFMAQKLSAAAIQPVLFKTLGEDPQQPALYIFNVNQDKGFVIVSGDDIITPILGYSANAAFGTSASPELTYWLNGYKTQIQAAVKAHLSPTQKTTDAWTSLMASGNHSGHTAQRATGVSPLLETLWDQMPRYNNLCPVPGGNYSSTPTGCVATAMAQIMYYWQTPTQGVSSNSYSSSTIGGTLSANFGATTYDWADMPVSLSSSSSATEINAIATLMFHCGVAVEMDYNTAQVGGSGAEVINYGDPTYPCSQNAFEKYFSYKNTITGYERAHFSDSTWIKMLKFELDNGRPILYAGFGSDGGHAFDFDGYDENDMFHINWGWSGMSNGYFTVDSLAPSALGVGANAPNFNYGQQALIMIEPAGSTLPANPYTPDVAGPDIALNNPSVTSGSTITFNDPYSISTEIKNLGNDTFANDNTLVLAAVDSQGYTYLIDTVSATISPGAIYTYSFSTQHMNLLDPGMYILVYLYMDPQQGINVIGDGGGINGSVYLTILSSTGISQPAAHNGFHIFPNPASDYVMVTAKDGAEKIITADLYDMSGRQLFHKSPAESSSSLQIPVSAYANGIYFLRLETTKGRIVQKISVKK